MQKYMIDAKEYEWIVIFNWNIWLNFLALS